MTPAPTSPSLLERLWGMFTSLRLTLVLLIILAVVSLVGTVRAQVFATAWFLAPLGLFACNLTACLIRGLPQAVRRCRQRLTPAGALELPERARFTWPPDCNPHTRVEGALRRELGPGKKAEEGEEAIYFWERGRLRPLGPYVVHVSLLFILAGALVGKFFSIDGQLALVEGETAQSFATPEGERPLSFTVRLDRFQVLYYPDGTPREFRSDLTFLKSDGSNEQAVCRVNDPVTFGGLSFYQSRWDKSVRLRLEEGGNSREMEVVVNRVVELPEGKGKFRVLDFEENLVRVMGDRPVALGPAARLVYVGPDGGHPQLVRLLMNHPEVFPQSGPHRFFLIGKGSRLLSIFQVKRDPGVWWVYLGFLLLLPGFYLAFLRPPERWALVMRRNPKGAWDVRLLGAAPRAREVFQSRLERLREVLQKGGAA